MISAADKLAIANRFSLPPPLVAALDGKTPPEGLLANFGMTTKEAEANPAASLTIVAHALTQAFEQHGSLNSALSAVYGGSADAFESPTSPVNGKVIGIIAEASTKLSQGWEGYSPSQPNTFGAIAKDIGGFLRNSRDLGVVSDDAISFWDHAVNQVAPQPKTSATSVNGSAAAGGDLHAPLPKGPTPKAVEAFAGQMQSLGIDVDHFLQHFPLYSALRYKLLSSKTSLQDYAPANGLQPAQMLQQIRDTPHPVYNHLTAGEYADAHDLAWLHSVNYQRRTPAPAEVARFAGSKANWTQVASHYQNMGAKRQNAS